MGPPRFGPPFRADHVGSLIRPPAVIEARHALREGRLRPEDLRPIEDAAIREVVAFQENLGLQVVTDGEYRRGAFFSHFVKAVEGLNVRETTFTFHNDAGEQARAYAPYTEGRLRRTHGICTEELRFLATVTHRTPKVTMPAPSHTNFLGGRERVSRDAYADLDEYWADLVGVYRGELAALAALGARYVQIDEVPLAMLGDPQVREAVRALGEDPERLTQTYLDAIEAAVAERPPGLIIGLHLCRGNYRGKWLAEGGYEAIAERLFSLRNVDVYLLEYDSPRAGDFAPLRELPRHKGVVLGLVSTKTAAIESAATIRHRLDAASRVVPLDQLGLGPQCGFATNLTGSPMTVEDQRRKLRLIVELAQEVWR